MDPAEFFNRLGEAQQEASEAQMKAEYYGRRLQIEVATFHNECKNPNTKGADLDFIRERIHEVMDQHLDAVQSGRMIADKFNASQNPT